MKIIRFSSQTDQLLCFYLLQVYLIVIIFVSIKTTCPLSFSESEICIYSPKGNWYATVAPSRIEISHYGDVLIRYQ